MVPVVDGIRDEYAGVVDIVVVDCYTDEGSLFADRLGVQYLPTFVFVNGDGEIQESATIIGSTTADALRAALDALR